MVQVELNNIDINMGENNGIEKLGIKKTPRLPVSGLKRYMLHPFMFIQGVSCTPGLRKFMIGKP
jgi:hypothetical protein